MNRLLTLRIPEFLRDKGIDESAALGFSDFSQVFDRVGVADGSAQRGNRDGGDEFDDARALDWDGNQIASYQLPRA